MVLPTIFVGLRGEIFVSPLSPALGTLCLSKASIVPNPFALLDFVTAGTGRIVLGGDFGVVVESVVISESCHV